MATFDPMAFGDRLQEARVSKGITHRALATELGVSTSQLWGWLRGERIPSAAHSVALAELLGVEIDWLLLGRTSGAAKEVVRELGTIAPDLIRLARKAQDV